MAEKRLIDANALIEEINQQRRASKTDFPRRSYVVGDVLTSIYNAPTVDAVEVKRGEWIACGDGDYVPFMCSHCGKTTAHIYKIMYGNFCPNCGAKMDLGRRNDDDKQRETW